MVGADDLVCNACCDVHQSLVVLEQVAGLDLSQQADLACTFPPENTPDATPELAYKSVLFMLLHLAAC